MKFIKINHKGYKIITKHNGLGRSLLGRSENRMCLGKSNCTEKSAR